MFRIGSGVVGFKKRRWQHVSLQFQFYKNKNKNLSRSMPIEEVCYLLKYVQSNTVLIKDHT